MPKDTKKKSANPIKKKVKVKVSRRPKVQSRVYKRRKGQVPRFVFRSKVRPSRRIGSGGVLKKSAALGRLIKWPKYVQLQRQRKVLLQRLKIPPSLNIFRNACSKEFAYKLVKFLQGYKPETRIEKRNRLRAWARMQEAGETPKRRKPNVIQYGFNHVTNLVETGRARLVIIAHDVDPIELVLWMPSLCVKKNVPFVIFKSKARLGTLVNQKTASCICISTVDVADSQEFKLLQREAKRLFNGRYNTLKKRWGKRQLGIKTIHKIAKRRRIRLEERAKRKKAMAGQQRRGGKQPKK